MLAFGLLLGHGPEAALRTVSAFGFGVALMGQFAPGWLRGSRHYR